MNDVNEAKRKDPVMRARIQKNLLQKADDCDNLLLLVDEIEAITDTHIWHVTEVGRLLARLRTHFADGANIRSSANNDTYIGNLAVLGREI